MDEVAAEKPAVEETTEDYSEIFKDFHAGLVEYVNKKISDSGGKLPLNPVFNSLNNMYFSLISNSDQAGSKIQFLLHQFVYIAEALIKAEMSKDPPASVEQPLPETTQ